MNPSWTTIRAQGAIDLLAWLGQWPFRLASRAEVPDLVALADTLGLQGLCISHIASLFGHDTRTGNEALFAAARQDERLWPFPLLNPAEPEWERELDWAAGMGARGVRLAPGYHGYDLNHPALFTLLDAVRQAGLPLHVCAKLQDERLHHPLYRVPSVPLLQLADLIVLAAGHPLAISGLRTLEWDELLRHRNLNADQRIEHVVVDLWHVNGPLGVLSHLCQTGHERRFAYGTNTPIQAWQPTALQMDTAAVAPAHLGLLAQGNAARFLGL